MEQQVDLLGEPRLKNGLAYYAGVQTSHGTVIVGNVVRLQLQAEGAVPYVGFGYLKGLWLWRDQPYVRVQHMAPSRTDLPKDAIVYTGEETSETELMVTNRVGDLHLNAMLGPVNISDGPLLSQLFQENVGADAESFSARATSTRPSSASSRSTRPSASPQSSRPFQRRYSAAS